MSEPTEREWLEGIGEQFEREHEDGRVTVRVERTMPCVHRKRKPHWVPRWYCTCGRHGEMCFPLGTTPAEKFDRGYTK